MLSKNQLKYYASLLNKKYRQKEHKFIAEGKRLIEEGLNSNFELEVILLSSEFARKEEVYYNRYLKNYPVETVSNSDFQKLSDTKNPQGIAAVFHMHSNSRDISKNKTLIIGLEDISEPGNLGTILRNCDWFGFTDVILSPNCAEIYNPKTLRASMGAIFHLNILLSENFYEKLQDFVSQGRKLFIADMEGKSIYDIHIDKNSVIIFSNEAAGPTAKLKRLSSASLTIPKFGMVESLNVASSSAVILSKAAESNYLRK